MCSTWEPQRVGDPLHGCVREGDADLERNRDAVGCGAVRTFRLARAASLVWRAAPWTAMVLAPIDCRPTGRSHPSSRWRERPCAGELSSCQVQGWRGRAAGDDELRPPWLPSCCRCLGGDRRACRPAPPWVPRSTPGCATSSPTACRRPEIARSTRSLARHGPRGASASSPSSPCSPWRVDAGARPPAAALVLAVPPLVALGSAPRSSSAGPGGAFPSNHATVGLALLVASAAGLAHARRGDWGLFVGADRRPGHRDRQCQLVRPCTPGRRSAACCSSAQ